MNYSVRVNLGNPHHDGTVGSGYVLEQMMVEIPVTRLRQIADARTVEGQLGLTPFELSASQLAELRALADRIGRAPSSGR